MVSTVNSPCPEPDSVTGDQGPPPSGVAEEWYAILGVLPADIAEELRKLSAGGKELLLDVVRDVENHEQDRHDQLKQNLPAIAEGPSGLRIYNPEQ